MIINRNPLTTDQIYEYLGNGPMELLDKILNKKVEYEAKYKREPKVIKLGLREHTILHLFEIENKIGSKRYVESLYTLYGIKIKVVRKNRHLEVT